MARNWIKIETVTPDKPEICAIATHLKIDPDAALGKLVRLWAWAEVNKVDGNAVNVTREFLDKVVGQARFAEALEVAGWLSGSDQALVFTRFAKHNGKAARDRALTAERVTRHRERKRESNEKNVTDDVTESGVPPIAVDESISVKTNFNALRVNELKVDQNTIPEVEMAADLNVASVVDQPNAKEIEVPIGNVLESAIEGSLDSVAVDELPEEVGNELKEDQVGNADLTEKQRIGNASATKRKVSEDPPEQALLF